MRLVRAGAVCHVESIPLGSNCLVAPCPRGRGLHCPTRAALAAQPSVSTYHLPLSTSHLPHRELADF